MNSFVRTYSVLLNLYPVPHRALFASEMFTVFSERLTECHDPGCCRRFIVSEFSGLLQDVAAAWLSQIRHAIGHDENCGCLPDFRKMRPPWTEAKSYYRLLRSPRKETHARSPLLGRTDLSV
jgi:hypothetical protein